MLRICCGASLLLDTMMHVEIIAAKHVYEMHGIACTDMLEEHESVEYAAATFQLHHKKIIFRAGKITPAKTGQFVTIWKRNEHNITIPFEDTDAFDLFMLAARKEGHIGYFIFPKAVLLEQKIIAGNSSAGKRGIRIYPPWDTTESKQAKATQAWQLPYFIDFSEKEIRRELLLRLLHI